MDKLQKIGSWIWYNKERMVLAVMVLVLAYRVYQVLNPPPPRQWAMLAAPRMQLPDDAESRERLGLPSVPPPRPPMTLPGDYVSFYERNPFWYYSGTAGQDTGQDVRVEDLNIQLLDIQTGPDGNPRARLRTRTTAWYSEGDTFEEFEVTRIDPDTNSVVVYSERYGRPFTLEKR